MTTKLFLGAITKFSLGVALVGLLLFLPAGTLSYFNGWLLMGILFVPMFLAGVVMIFKNPDLLKSRLDAKEKAREQKLVVKLSGLMFLSGFVLAGLGVRFHWYVLPIGVAIGAAFAVFTGFGTALGQASVAAKAVEAVGRQPEAVGAIRTTMIMGQAVAETTGIYGFITALIMIFVL